MHDPYRRAAVPPSKRPLRSCEKYEDQLILLISPLDRRPRMSTLRRYNNQKNNLPPTQLLLTQSDQSGKPNGETNQSHPVTLPCTPIRRNQHRSNQYHYHNHNHNNHSNHNFRRTKYQHHQLLRAAVPPRTTLKHGDRPCSAMSRMKPGSKCDELLWNLTIDCRRRFARSTG